MAAGQVSATWWVERGGLGQHGVRKEGTKSRVQGAGTHGECPPSRTESRHAVEQISTQVQSAPVKTEAGNLQKFLAQIFPDVLAAPCGLCGQPVLAEVTLSPAMPPSKGQGGKSGQLCGHAQLWAKVARAQLGGQISPSHPNIPRWG